MNYSKVPGELKKLRQWTCWKFEDRRNAAGEVYRTKLPVDMYGHAYKWSDPRQWISFEDACKGKTQLIGFFFGSGIVGVDLDKCRNVETGAIEQWASDTIKELNSYTELSPSKTGFHIYVRGVLPKEGNRKGRMEIYSQGRFFTVTGEHVAGTPEAVQPCEHLAEIQAKMLAGLAPELPKAPTAKPDESGEDFKLVRHVYQETKFKDAAKLEKEIETRYPERFAARNKEKGTRQGKTYFRYTCENFLKDVKDEKPETKPDKVSIEFITADKVQMERVDWLWENRIPYGMLTVFAGIPGTGKSTVTADLVARLTTGLPFPDVSNNQFPVDVAMLVSEDSLSHTVVPRLAAAGAELKLVHFVSKVRVPENGKPQEMQIALNQDLEAVAEKIRRHEYIRLVVIDPLASYLGTLKKNDDSHMRPLLVQIANFALEQNIAVLTVGHLNKNSERAAIDRLSGAGSLIEVPRAAWLFLNDPDDAEKKTRIMTKLKGNILDPEKSFGLKYRISGVDVPMPSGEPLNIGAVTWTGKDDQNRTADEIIGKQNEAISDPESGKIEPAKKWICEQVKDQPKLSREIYAECESAGFSEMTIRRAMKALGCVPYQTRAGWWTKLPGSNGAKPETEQPADDQDSEFPTH